MTATAFTSGCGVLWGVSPRRVSTTPSPPPERYTGFTSDAAKQLGITGEGRPLEPALESPYFYTPAYCMWGANHAPYSIYMHIEFYRNLPIFGTARDNAHEAFTSGQESRVQDAKVGDTTRALSDLETEWGPAYIYATSLMITLSRGIWIREGSTKSPSSTTPSSESR